MTAIPAVSYSTLAGIYRNLLANPGDADVMHILADALEDLGRLDLARAYRWAASRSKWPFVRWQWKAGPVRNVYDWDGEGRTSRELVLPSAQLPIELWRAIRLLPKRKYGGVNRAFVLLARVLPRGE